MFKYSSGRLLHTTRSGNHVIEVRENWRYRWLHFGGPSIQSAMKRRSPAALALPYLKPIFAGIHLFSPQPQSMTLLGVGGASVVRYTRQHFPKCHITAIEIDPTIVEIASRYFGLPADDETFSLIVADANDYLHHPDKHVDLIIIDIYENEELPTVLYDNEFYLNARLHLTENGVLCVNIVYSLEVELVGVLSAIKSAFGNHTLCVPVKGYRNVIVFASQDPNFIHTIETAKRSKVRELRLDPQLGYVATLP